MKQLGIIVLAATFGWFTWWLVSPLLFDARVDDELPQNALPPNPTTVEPIALPQLESAEDVTAETSQPTELPNNSGERVSDIQDTANHPASGQVRIVTTPEEQIVRFENYDGTNGPDLHIYLADDLDATNFIDLGPARANQGNINYAVPMDIDIDDYAYVLTWDETFDVLFDYAEIK